MTRPNLATLEEAPSDPAAWRVLSPKDTAAKVGVSMTTLGRIVADEAKGFPLAVQITERRIGYLEHEVAAWIRSQVAPRRILQAKRTPPSRT